MASKKKNPAAVAMAKRRVETQTPERRREIAKKAIAARWAGHVAKRPASSRKKPAAKKKAK